MKNLIKIFLLILISNNTQAQNACEFDSIYRKSNEKGYKIAESNDKKLFVASIDGYSVDISVPNFSLNLNLNLIDECGTLIWKKQIDSCLGVNSYSEYAKIIDFIKRPNGNLFYLAYYYGKLKAPALPGIQIFNINLNGEVIWKKRMVDSTNSYDLTSATEINPNAFLLAGSKNGKAHYLICDTLLNIITQNTLFIDSTKTSLIQKVYAMPNNSFSLLGMEDTIAFIKTINSSGNILNELKIYTNKIYTNKAIDYNYSKSNFVLSGLKVGSNTSSNYASYALNGNLIKDTLFSTNFQVKQLLPNLYLLVNKYSWIKTDSNFNTISVDNYTNIYDGIGPQKSKYVNNFYQSNNNIYGTGIYLETSGLSTSLNSLFLKKINLINYVSNITIIGNSSINVKRATISLNVNVLPTTANNKNFTWSINDSNLATITQTGLVTSKANGTVIVTATAADGGGSKATKTITISNQNVGINEANLNNQITVYPNPASNMLTIKTFNNLAIQQLFFLEITGKIIAQFNSQTEIDLTNIANGMYLLQIQTENGNLIKQVVVNR
jgi:uncharacterized protein YjdB